MFDKLHYNILLYCILPRLQDAELRSLYSLCKKTMRIVHEYCMADKTSIRVLCQRGDLLIIYKRDLIVDNTKDSELICERGYINLIRKTFLSRRHMSLYGHGLQGACRGGRRNIVDLMISLSIKTGYANWDKGLQGACEGGYLEIIDLMIGRCNNHWSWGLEGACWRGCREIIDLIITSVSYYKGVVNWSFGLQGACRGGHRNIIDLMIEKGANNWNLGLYGACRGGHREIVDWMITLLNNNGEIGYWNGGLTGACEESHKDIVNLMIEKGATHCNSCQTSAKFHDKGL